MRRGLGCARRGLLDHQSLILRRDRRAAQCLDEAGRGALGHLEIAFVCRDPDRADVVAADMAVAADQRQQPAGIGIVAPAGVDPEPGRALESRPRSGFAALVPAAGRKNILRRRKVGAEATGPARRRSLPAKAASISCSASCRSSSSTSTGAESVSRSRSRSFARICSGSGGSIHSASMRALRSMVSTFRRRRNGTISTAMPLRPARPVRPDRCWSASASRGSSTWMTSETEGRSMPRAATSVATQTRARLSRKALQGIVALVLAMLAG